MAYSANVDFYHLRFQECLSSCLRAIELWPPRRRPSFEGAWGIGDGKRACGSHMDFKSRQGLDCCFYGCRLTVN